MINCRPSESCNRSGATRTTALAVSKTFRQGFLYWSSSQFQILWNFRSGFWLFSCFISNRRLWVVLDGKALQEYPVNAGVPQGSILRPTLFLTGSTLITFLMMVYVILLFVLMILLSTFNYDQAFDLLQQLELAPELESDLRDTAE